jgi:hypothetical protein
MVFISVSIFAIPLHEAEITFLPGEASCIEMLYSKVVHIFYQYSRYKSDEC